MRKLSVPAARSRFPLILSLGFFVVLGVFGIVAYQSQDEAAAAMPPGWNAGRIIDDSVFTAHTSMSASSIQSFLAGKVPACDTYGQKISEYGGPDLNGDGKVQRWEWGKKYYNQTKFICLKDYIEGGKKASQIIYDIAQQYRISPKVLIVLLQKEQGLVTDTWPLNIQYKTATGYACPDTAPCDTQYYGFTNQVRWAATMFRAIMDASPTWYTPYVLGNNYIQYNPNKSCGGSTVNIVNRATQALYNYTPYQPNSYALNGGSSSAYPYCGAFGNRNFFTFFSNWFGQPNAAATYSYSVVSQEVYSDSTYTTKIGTTAATIKPSTAFYIKVTVKNTGNQVWYNNFLRMGTQNPQDRLSPFKDGSWISGARPAAMLEASVPAGGLATFKFKALSPSSLQSYDESFGVLLEGQRWLGGSLIKFTFNVSTPDPVYAAQTTSFDVYKDSGRTKKLNVNDINVYTDSRFYVTMKIKNVGNRDFPAGITKLATTNPRDRASIFSDESWLSSGRVVLANEGALVPGQTGTFPFTMTAPSSSTGNFLEQFGLVIEGQRWVDENLGLANIDVSARPPSTIQTGGTLLKTQSLLSSNEIFRFSFQTDGNLVLYDTTGKALWHTRTSGSKASKLILQTDGNLVLYDTTGKALWHTRTSQG